MTAILHKGLGMRRTAHFSAIVGHMGQKYGAPYNQFPPLPCSKSARRQSSDWGTICGARCSGPASAYALFWEERTQRDGVELYRWYETAKRPIFNPRSRQGRERARSFPTSVADSVLCHVSWSRCASKNMVEANSKARSERCAASPPTHHLQGRRKIMNAKSTEPSSPLSLLRNPSPPAANVNAKGSRKADNKKSVMSCTTLPQRNEPLMNKSKIIPKVSFSAV